MNQIINGLRHGPWELYYYNGQLYYKGKYVNGQQQGLWEEYYQNGKLISKEFYL